MRDGGERAGGQQMGSMVQASNLTHSLSPSNYHTRVDFMQGLGQYGQYGMPLISAILCLPHSFAREISPTHPIFGHSLTITTTTTAIITQSQFHSIIITKPNFWGSGGIFFFSGVTFYKNYIVQGHYHRQYHHHCGQHHHHGHLPQKAQGSAAPWSSSARPTSSPSTKGAGFEGRLVELIGSLLVDLCQGLSLHLTLHHLNNFVI